MSLEHREQHPITTSLSGSESNSIFCKGYHWFLYSKLDSLYLVRYNYEDGSIEDFGRIRTNITSFHVSNALNDNLTINDDKIWVFEVTSNGSLNLLELEPFVDKQPTIESWNLIQDDIISVSAYVVEGNKPSVSYLRNDDRLFIRYYSGIKTNEIDREMEVDWSAQRDHDFSYYNNNLSFSEPSSPYNIGIQSLIFTVTFNSNGGTEIDSQEVESGELINKPGNPEKSGYYFIGWYKDPSLSEVWDFDTDVVYEETTLYSGWVSSSISSIQDLWRIRYVKTGFFTLLRDLDLLGDGSYDNTTPDSTTWVDATAFKNFIQTNGFLSLDLETLESTRWGGGGAPSISDFTLDGGNHTIFNFKFYLQSNSEYQGLIIAPGNNVTIKNLIFDGIRYENDVYRYFATFFCRCIRFYGSNNLKLINCHIFNAVYKSMTGSLGSEYGLISGFVHEMDIDSALIENCSFNGSIYSASPRHVSGAFYRVLNGTNVVIRNIGVSGSITTQPGQSGSRSLATGLFSQLFSRTTVKILENINIDCDLEGGGVYGVGTYVRVLEGGFKNIHVTGNLKSHNKAICPLCYSASGTGDIVNCSFTGNMDSNSVDFVFLSEGTGGLVGMSLISGVIRDCCVKSIQPWVLRGRYDSFGGICGAYGSVIDCTAEIDIITEGDFRVGDGFGGIVGGHSEDVSGCKVKGSFDLSNVSNALDFRIADFGGIVGVTYNGDIINCSFEGDVDVTGLELTVGGICGASYTGYSGGVIDGCYHNGDIIVNKNHYDYSYGVGGIVGFKACVVRNSYHIGDINLLSEYGAAAGGLIGVSESGFDTVNCYFVGKINKNNSNENELGYLIGSLFSGGNITNCYWNSDLITEELNVWGNETGKTTGELQDISTFSNWDISPLIEVYPGPYDPPKYPQLSWEYDTEGPVWVIDDTKSAVTYVNYNSTGADTGSPPQDDTAYNSGDELTIAGPGTLEKDNHEFIGWRLGDYQNYEGIINPLKEQWNVGDTLQFEIPDEVLTDGDGNIYTTVVIGNQEWSVENWWSTSYMDGTPIPHVTDNSEWDGLSTPAYCWLYNDSARGYGALYNWWVVDPANPKQIAPEGGWRVPTDEDWTALQDYLIANGYNWDGTTSGNKIGKALASSGGEWDPSGTVGYVGNNQSGNNSSGFSALPNGYRVGGGGSFGTIGVYDTWWSATEYNASFAWLRILYYDDESLFRFNYDKGWGFSVRLVRDI